MINVTEIKSIRDQWNDFPLWKGLTQDGRFIYVRVRYSMIEIVVAKNEWIDAKSYKSDPGNLLFSRDIDPSESEMSLERVQDVMKDTIRLPKC